MCNTLKRLNGLDTKQQANNPNEGKKEDRHFLLEKVSNQVDDFHNDDKG